VLRRELRFWEAIALSIAVMAPTAAMALNGTLPATLIGQAVPLAFIFATRGRGSRSARRRYRGRPRTPSAGFNAR
jgi:hypothetical protein